MTMPDPNRDNYSAFENERKELLRDYRGQYAAYHNGTRLCVDPSEEVAYQEARSQVPIGAILAQHIIPKNEEPVFRLGRPIEQKTVKH